MNVEPESKTNEYLKGIVANLPEKPGIYQYLNTEGTIIYVGKAKNLKKRVYSYFSKEHEPGKTRILVSQVYYSCWILPWTLFEVCPQGSQEA